jgi:hypothetical protein
MCLSRRQLAVGVPSPEQHVAIAENLELDSIRLAVAPQRGLQGVMVLPDTPERFIRCRVAEHQGQLTRRMGPGCMKRRDSVQRVNGAV